MDSEIEEIKLANIWTTYLKNEVVDKKELQELFKKATLKNDQDAVIVALLHFLNSCLLGLPCKSKIKM